MGKQRRECNLADCFAWAIKCKNRNSKRTILTNRYQFLFFLLGLSLCLQGRAQIAGVRADDPVLAMIDSLDVVKFFEGSKFTAERDKMNIYKFPLDSVPNYPDDVYAKRIAKLDAVSPFELVYNEHVRSFINLYAIRKRNIAHRVLGLAEMYFPMFEEKLSKHNLPLELKYLSIVESALNPIAKSRAGAMGLWQFMYRTGLMYGLNVNSYVDERCDPELSTEAACKYLKYLHSLYNDWNLALAAYNAGPGNVNKAIRRSGGKSSYWEVRPYLPVETQSYVPAFAAVVYVMNYHKEHNIFPLKPKYFNYEIDSIHVGRNVSFKQISSVLNISIDDLRFLNPMYIKDIIPGSYKPYPLYLPKKLMGEYMANENVILFLNEAEQVSNPGVTSKTADSAAVSRPEIQVSIPAEVQYVKKYHTVKPGEYLTSIARNYQVKVSDLMEWNHLRTTTLAVGQKLQVSVPKSSTEQQNISLAVESTPGPALNPQKEAKIEAPKSYKYYTVRNGDTLYKISEKHGVSIGQIMKLNNMKSKVVRVGEKLKIKVG